MLEFAMASNVSVWSVEEEAMIADFDLVQGYNFYKWVIFVGKH